MYQTMLLLSGRKSSVYFAYLIDLHILRMSSTVHPPMDGRLHAASSAGFLASPSVSRRENGSCSAACGRLVRCAAAVLCFSWTPVDVVHVCRTHVGVVRVCRKHVGAVHLSTAPVSFVVFSSCTQVRLWWSLVSL